MKGNKITTFNTTVTRKYLSFSFSRLSMPYLHGHGAEKCYRVERALAKLNLVIAMCGSSVRRCCCGHMRQHTHMNGKLKKEARDLRGGETEKKGKRENDRWEKNENIR